MKRLLKNIFLKIALIFFSCFYKLDSKKVLFRSYNGLNYNCNPKAISEKLHELSPDMKIVWCFCNPHQIKNLPSYVKTVKKGTFNEFKELFTAKFWVFNAGIIIPRKRAGQFYMDTWHGDRAFKKVDISADGSTRLLDSYKNADVLLSGSDYGDNVIRLAMNFNGEILRTGSPRNDIFFKNSEPLKKQIKETLSIKSFDSILTYAPTFRNNGDKMDSINLTPLLNALEKRDGQKWGALVRQHYKVKECLNHSKDARIIDASHYPDIQDILLVSDIVISDYSSLVGDFALLKRPVVLYVPDLQEYASGRGLYFEIEKSPFIYATNETELLKKVLSITPDIALKNCNDILNFYGHVTETGNASNTAAQWILTRV